MGVVVKMGLLKGSSVVGGLVRMDCRKTSFRDVELLQGFNSNFGCVGQFKRDASFTLGFPR